MRGVVHEKIAVFDTTLRDGEQAAGQRLGPSEKLEIARRLDRLGVDVIEAGYPASSKGDAAAVESIGRAVRRPVIAALSRAVGTDIEACARALESARNPRIHTGISVSDVHILGKFRDERYGRTLEEKRRTVLSMAQNAVRKARQYVDDVEFYAEDSGRADRTFLFAVLESVIASGATMVNIADTTGYCMPDEFGELVRSVRDNVTNAAGASFSVHCHDDLGMAVANTMAGIAAGADQVECTVNGIGERAGNAALEEVVMALKVRGSYYNRRCGVVTTELSGVSALVAEKLSLPVPRNKAVTGGNAFAHSSGIHVDGVLKDRETYEIIDPVEVGSAESRLVLTARSGRHALRHRLGLLGVRVCQAHLERIYSAFVARADTTTVVTDDMLSEIVAACEGRSLHQGGGHGTRSKP